jgi:hypothetical protein
MPTNKATRSKPVPPLSTPVQTRQILVQTSIGLNALALILLLVFGVTYYSGSLSLAKATASISNNVCFRNVVKEPQAITNVTKSINGITETAHVIRLSQAQINSTCFTTSMAVDEYAYYAAQPTNASVADAQAEFVLLAGPNGKILVAPDVTAPAALQQFAISPLH